MITTLINSERRRKATIELINGKYVVSCYLNGEKKPYTSKEDCKEDAETMATYFLDLEK